MAERRAVRAKRAMLKPLVKPKRHQSGVVVEQQRRLGSMYTKGGGFRACLTPEEASEEYAAMVKRLKKARLPYSSNVKLFHFGELKDETVIESASTKGRVKPTD